VVDAGGAPVSPTTRRVARRRRSPRPVLMAGVGIAVVVAAVVGGFGSGNSPLSPESTTTTTAPAPASPPSSPTTSLPPRPAQRMLVLYDTSGEWASIGAIDSILTANLAGRFGPATRLPVQQYTAGTMSGYDGVVYIGSSYDEPLPTAFLDDVVGGSAPVVWVGLNLWQLDDRLVRGGFGFTGSDVADVRTMTGVRYGGTELPRSAAGEAAPVMPVTVTDPSAVTVLGTIVAPDGTEQPWAVRSRHLTHLVESPYVDMSEGDRYLAWADVLIGAFDPEAPVRHRALVRLEDIGPLSDPKLLRASIDVLIERGVPFTMAVYPLFADPQGSHGTAYGSKGVPVLRLDQRPDVVAVIRYGLDHGGTVVSHGLTHQYRTEANPYDGLSGSDFEFYRAHVDPATDNVELDGPVAEDSVDWAADRLEQALAYLVKAGIPADRVRMFEVAHYAASDAAYRAIGQVYAGLNGDRPPTRFERGMYFPERADGTLDTGRATNQFMPYPVVDVYGHLIVPENLGNVIEVGYNNNDPRSPADIVATAKRSLVVRDGVAGFFFHPYLDAGLLAETVDGIRAAGFEFVPSTSIDAGWVGNSPG